MKCMLSVLALRRSDTKELAVQRVEDYRRLEAARELQLDSCSHKSKAGGTAERRCTLLNGSRAWVVELNIQN